jgi:hypothetical protein
MEKIGLAEVIAALRLELDESMRAAESSGLRFLLGEVAVELELAVERTGGGSGGLKFWVVQAGAEGRRSSARTHRITVPLTPIARDGGAVYTGDNAIPGE